MSSFLQDEVLAISEKVVLRVEDLVTWITLDAEWSWGRLAKCVDDLKECKDTDNDIVSPLTEGSLDFSDVEKEKKLLGKQSTIIVLNMLYYC